VACGKNQIRGNKRASPLKIFPLRQKSLVGRISDVVVDGDQELGVERLEADPYNSDKG